jgi:hypothetical protein
VIVKENGKYKDWSINDIIDVNISQQVIDIRQTIINILNIKDGFQSKYVEHCTYTKEEYFERRNIEKL